MAGSNSTLWLKLAQSIKTLWDDGPLPEPVKAVASGRRPPSRGPVADTAQWLERLMLRDPTIRAKLHILSLVEFRESVGDKWPRLTDKVAIIVEQAIGRRIGRGNAFCRDAEDTWILAFPELSPDEARRNTLAIVHDIGHTLYGQQGGEPGGSVALAAEVPAGELVAEDGQVNGLRLRSAVDEARAIVSDPWDDEGGESDWLPPDDDDPMGQWTSLDRSGRNRRDPTAWEVMEPGAAKPAVFDPYLIGPMPAGSHLSLMWRPTWVAAGYGARVVRQDGEGEKTVEGCRAYPMGDVPTALALDRFVVASAVRDILATARAAGPGTAQVSVILPLSWDSLASDQRGSVVIPLSNLTQETRNSQLVIEIFNIPDGTSTPELEAVVSYVGTLCREVLVRTRITARRSSLAGEIGVSMVGLDLSELRPDQRMDDDDLLAVLDRVREATIRDGIGCYLWGARHRRVVGGLVQGGFEMVNGPGLMKDIGRPAMVLPAPRSRFTPAA